MRIADWKIIGSDGTDLGTFAAANTDRALDMLANRSGASSFQYACICFGLPCGVETATHSRESFDRGGPLFFVDLVQGSQRWA
jgi:hypothetical protein